MLASRYFRAVSLLFTLFLVATNSIGLLAQPASAASLAVSNGHWAHLWDVDTGIATTVFSDSYGSAGAIAVDPLDGAVYYWMYQGSYYKDLMRYNIADGSTDPVYGYTDNQYHPHSLDINPLDRTAITHYEEPAFDSQPYNWIKVRNVDTNAAVTIHNEMMSYKYLIGCNAGGYCSYGRNYLHNIEDIAIDAINRQVYWTDSVTGQILRKSVDGTTAPEVLFSGLVKPNSLALDVGAGAIWWSEQGDASNPAAIRRAGMGGSGPIVDVITTFTDKPWRIDVDPLNARLYWIDNGTVRHSDYSGAGTADFTNSGGSPVSGGDLAVGLDAGAAPQSPLMPDVVDPDTGFFFDGVVIPSSDVMLFFDPQAALGYEYSVSGSDFSSVLLPLVGDGLYDLYIHNGSHFVYEQQLAAGAVYNFGAGINRFRVMGIEPEAGLDPGDPSAFVTGLTFSAPGLADLTMVAIVPEPAGLSLLGLVMLLAARGRRW